MENILITIAVFAGLQTANVILQSLRTLLMAKVDCPHKNAAMNAVAFGFYVVIVQQVANIPLMVTIPLTVVTNVIGIYATFAIFSKMRKDELWKVEIYNPKQYHHEVTQGLLEEAGIAYKAEAEKFTIAYCYTQAESQEVKKILALLAEHGIRHNVTKVGKL